MGRWHSQSFVYFSAPFAYFAPRNLLLPRSQQPPWQPSCLSPRGRSPHVPDREQLRPRHHQFFRRYTCRAIFPLISDLFHQRCDICLLLGDHKRGTEALIPTDSLDPYLHTEITRDEHYSRTQKGHRLDCYRSISNLWLYCLFLD
jgi:hypothetical protein